SVLVARGRRSGRERHELPRHPVPCPRVVQHDRRARTAEQDRSVLNAVEGHRRPGPRRRPAAGSLNPVVVVLTIPLPGVAQAGIALVVTAKLHHAVAVDVVHHAVASPWHDAGDLVKSPPTYAVPASGGTLEVELALRYVGAVARAQNGSPAQA